MADYKAVIIGAAHMHVLYVAKDALDTEGLSVAGIADTAPLMREFDGAPPFTRNFNLKYVTETLGIKKYDSYTDMLDAVKPDVALVCTETPLHLEVFRECAKRGVAVSMEKPMATTLSDGLAMVRIAKTTGNTLMVNWPLAWQPLMFRYKQILDDGEMGRLLRVHQLVAHPGPLGRGVRHPRMDVTSDDTTGEEKAGTWWYNASTGGGAMLDFCCYGAMACNWLVGERAVSVMGMRANTNSQFGDADDNASIMVRYPGCLAVLEGSWTVPLAYPEPGPQLFCTEGVLYTQREGDKVLVKGQDFFGKVTTYPDYEMPPYMKNVSTVFVHHKRTGEPLPLFLDAEENIKVLGILDAGVRSANSGKEELVGDFQWQIG